jgi:hypothetical protein
VRDLRITVQKRRLVFAEHAAGSNAVGLAIACLHRLARTVQATDRTGIGASWHVYRSSRDETLVSGSEMLEAAPACLSRKERVNWLVDEFGINDRHPVAIVREHEIRGAFACSVPAERRKGRRRQLVSDHNGDRE